MSHHSVWRSMAQVQEHGSTKIEAAERDDEVGNVRPPIRQTTQFLNNKMRNMRFFFSSPISQLFGGRVLSIMLLFLLMILPHHPATAQQTASINIPLFTTNVSLSHRQNVCNRANALDSGIRDDDINGLRYALEGMQLNVATGLSIYFRYEDGILNEDYPGLVPALLDELAERGKFSWRDSFAVYDGPGENHTWTEMVLFQTDFFDVAADWWMNTLTRFKMGIAFPEGWYDGSYILVASRGASTTKNQQSVNLWGWLLPFQPDVWIMILFTLIWSGVVYMFLEYLVYPGQYTGKRARESFGNDIFLSLLLFTQHFAFVPKTPASRILATSMALWALLISSAYTANLASFFVDQNQQNYEATSLEEAVRLGKPICVWESTPHAVLVQTQYPTGIYVLKSVEIDLYHGVNNGECALAVTTMTSYQDFSKRKDANADCNLDWVGSIIKHEIAGFATRTDAGRKCTSLIHDVLNFHILEMKADGSIEKMWTEHYTKTLDHFCAAHIKKDDHTQSQRMSLHEIGGTFAFHFAVTLFAVIVGVASKFWKVYRKRRLFFSTYSPPKQLPARWTELNKTDMPNSANRTKLPVTDFDKKATLVRKSTANGYDEDKSGTSEFTNSFIEDFWAETSESRILSVRRRSTINGAGNAGMGGIELMEVLQYEFEQQQDQLEEKLQGQFAALLDQKMEQQDAKMKQRQIQMEKRIEEKLQQQFGILMGFLKENQMGGSVAAGHRPSVPSNRSVITSLTASTEDEEDSQGSENTSTLQGNSKSTIRHHITNLLHTQEGQEFQGAKPTDADDKVDEPEIRVSPMNYYTSEDSISIQESTSGVRFRKVKSVDSDKYFI